MSENLYKKAIELLPTLFSQQLNIDKSGASIFEPLKNIIDFNEAFIFFLNPDSIILKYLYSQDRSYSIGTAFTIKKHLKDLLFSKENVVLSSSHDLLKALNIKSQGSFLVVKLVVKETVFGFMLLAKNEMDHYTNEHVAIASAVGAVISYTIKDIELSDIFRAQLKALQEGFVKTKDAYKTIKEQNVKIMEADKIKTEFLANISHELRTPLNAIIGFSEMLSTKFFGDLNDKQSEYVNDIYVSGIHLLGMINELLDISKLEAKAMTLNLSEFEVSQVVDEVVNVVKPLAAKKSIVITKEPFVDRIIKADFQKLKQILYNLVSNAIKFTPDKGRIDVAISFSQKSLYMLVKDTGIGISESDQKRIFDKFVQLENAYTKTQSSTGLGLTITKELAEMHNGKVSVISELGQGSEFLVEIPLAK